MTSLYRYIHYRRYSLKMDDPWADTADVATSATSARSGPSSPISASKRSSTSPERRKSSEFGSPRSPVRSGSPASQASPKRSLDAIPEKTTKTTGDAAASPALASPTIAKMDELSLTDQAPAEPGREEDNDEDDVWGDAPTPPTENPPVLAAPALVPPPLASTSGDAAFDDGFGDGDFGAPAESGGFGDDGFDDDGFDDFGDGFAEPVAAEDFGDFGDFDEGFNPPPEAAAPPPVIERTWHALSLRPVPPRRELALAIQDTLGLNPQGLTNEEPRAVGGLSQVLVQESNRDAYAQLTTAPMLKPLDWTRSRVRRDHLIAMGVPVNLDEVESHRLSTLPPLKITTDLANKPPPRVSEDKHGLGPKPTLDFAKAEELCAIEDDKLKLCSLGRLETVQRDLVRATNEASALLAYLAQLKDARQQDHETYNGMISELIANAAKAKTPSSSGVFGNRHSKRLSMSGNSTPRRVGSPMTR